MYDFYGIDGIYHHHYRSGKRCDLHRVRSLTFIVSHRTIASLEQQHCDIFITLFTLFDIALAARTPFPYATHTFMETFFFEGYFLTKLICDPEVVHEMSEFNIRP